MQAIGEGGSPVPLPEGGPREVRHAVCVFNAKQARIHRLVADRTQALAAVSHDLRTPIHRLRLQAEFLDNTEARQVIEAGLEEMEAMVEATLAYLRGETESEAPRSADLAAILRTLCDDAADRGAAVAYAGPGRASLRLRPLAAKRAFANLVDNAIKYGGTARVMLDDRPEAATVRVEDDGPGIPASEMEAVFEPFHRVEASRNRGTGGSGLGLTIARTARSRGRSRAGRRAFLRVPCRVPKERSPPDRGRKQPTEEAMSTVNRMSTNATVAALAFSLAFGSATLARAQSAQEHGAHHPGGTPTQAAPAPAPMPGPAQQQRGMPGMMGGQGMPMQGMQMQGGPGATQQGGMPGMMGDMGRMMDMMHRHRASQHAMRAFQHIEGTLAFYRTELRITDAQQAQWDAFADAVRSAAGTLKQAVTKAMQESGPVPAPEQIERRMALLTAQLEAMRTVQAAARPLYATLSDEQKRTADTLMAEHLRGMGGGMGMRGGMM